VCISEACGGLLLLKNMLLIVQKETLMMVEQFVMHVFMVLPVSSLVRMTSHNQGLFHLICINCMKRAMRLMSVKECNNYASNWHLTLHCIRGVLLHRLDLLYLLLLKNDNFASFCCSECGSCFLIRHFIDCCHVMFFGGWVRVCCLIRWSELLWLELILVTNLKH